MPIMSADPEYLRNRAKAAEVAGDDAAAEALNAEADEVENAPPSEGDAAPQ